MQSVAHDRLGEHAHLIRSLELDGVLDRALEHLPSADEIEDRRRAGRGLTRPRCDAAVLLEDRAQQPADRLRRARDAYLSGELDRYFPDRLSKRYAQLLGEHRCAARSSPRQPRTAS